MANNTSNNDAARDAGQQFANTTDNLSAREKANVDADGRVLVQGVFARRACWIPVDERLNRETANRVRVYTPTSERPAPMHDVPSHFVRNLDGIEVTLAQLRLIRGEWLSLAALSKVAAANGMEVIEAK